jgi:hypothetical protein
VKQKEEVADLVIIRLEEEYEKLQARSLEQEKSATSLAATIFELRLKELIKKLEPAPENENESKQIEEG